MAVVAGNVLILMLILSLVKKDNMIIKLTHQYLYLYIWRVKAYKISVQKENDWVGNRWIRSSILLLAR